MLFLLIQISGLVGSIAAARPSDRDGAKTVILVTLVQRLIVTTAAHFVKAKRQFGVVAVFAASASKPFR